MCLKKKINSCLRIINVLGITYSEYIYIHIGGLSRNVKHYINVCLLV
jgi:hypothetical protein